MPTTNTQTRKWTAAELLQLPPEERNGILEAAAELAEDEYQTNRELTDFEACGEDDLHVRSSDTETR